jgi:CRP-like cAMP-binding protein
MAIPFNEEVRLLSAADILKPLSQEEVGDLARRYPDTRLEPGEVLFAPHERGERLFILKEGHVRIYQTNPQGQEITLVVVEEGTLFGEMALTAQRMRGGYAQALEPSVVLSLGREDLEDLVLSKPEAASRKLRPGKRERNIERYETLSTELLQPADHSSPMRSRKACTICSWGLSPSPRRSSSSTSSARPNSTVTFFGHGRVFPGGIASRVPWMTTATTGTWKCSNSKPIPGLNCCNSRWASAGLRETTQGYSRARAPPPRRPGLRLGCGLHRPVPPAPAD